MPFSPDRFYSYFQRKIRIGKSEPKSKLYFHSFSHSSFQFQVCRPLQVYRAPVVLQNLEKPVTFGQCFGAWKIFEIQAKIVWSPGKVLELFIKWHCCYLICKHPNTLTHNININLLILSSHVTLLLAVIVENSRWGIRTKVMEILYLVLGKSWKSLKNKSHASHRNPAYLLPEQLAVSPSQSATISLSSQGAPDKIETVRAWYLFVSKLSHRLSVHSTLCCTFQFNVQGCVTETCNSHFVWWWLFAMKKMQNKQENLQYCIM